MTFPSDAVIRNRRGRVDARWLFICGRNGHKKIRKSFKAEAEREAFIHKHDGLFHFEEVAAGGAPPAVAPDVTLSEGIEAYMTHLRDLVERGVRSQKSVDWYTRLWPIVMEGLGPNFPLADMSVKTARGYVKWRFKHGTTQGSIIIKELKAIQTVQRYLEIPFVWYVPLDEIQAKRPKTVEEPDKLEVTPEVIARLLRAMKPTEEQWRELKGPSLEYSVTMVKVLTAMRTVELFDLRAGQVNLRTKTIHYTLRSKRHEYAHQCYIVPELADILRPWVAGKAADEHVFVITTKVRGRAAGRGIPKVRPLNDRTLRKRLAAASRRAQPPIDPPIESFKHIRHEAITAATQTLSLEATAKGTGHRSIETIEEHYLRRRHTDPAAARAFAEAVRDGFADVLHPTVN